MTKSAKEMLPTSQLLYQKEDRSYTVEQMMKKRKKKEGNNNLRTVEKYQKLGTRSKEKYCHLFKLELVQIKAKLSSQLSLKAN